MAKIASVMADLDKVEKGVWVDWLEDIKLCIASTNKRAYKQARQRLLKPYMRKIRSGAISNDKILDIVKPAFARHVLVDWKNIEGEDGKPVQYSPEKALEFFNDPALSVLYDFVIETAGESDFYRNDLVKEAEGN